MSISLTIDRSSISLSDLVITNSPFGTDMHLPEDGVAEFDFDYARSYAGGSTYAPRALLAAILEPTNLPLTILCHATSSAALATVKATLAQAVSQWAYDITVTVDGVSQTVTGEPTLPAFGAVDSGMVRAFISRAVLTIPINPQ